METLLVVDDDSGFRRLLTTILTAEGYQVETAASIKEALELGARKNFHLVLSNLKLPDGEGLAVLRWFGERAPETPVIVVTAPGAVAPAVEAMKLGAADYIGKPLSGPEELRLLVKRTIEQSRIAQEREALMEQETGRFDCQNLITRDAGMLHVLELARKVAPTNATVLITGESGAGKEVLARCIHANSPRSRHVFLSLDCTGLSPTAIESGLFGHEKGAFAEATAQHLGRFEQAHHGTLFLDEIAEFDANLQARLLRVLQDHTFERVGGSRRMTVDVRVIAATNRDLKRMVADGRFREDLYGRLSTFPLVVPPLRERRSDIVEMARFFLERAARNFRKPGLALTPQAECALLAYTWPGNVRELENVMERVAILCDRVVDAHDLPLGQEFGAGEKHPTLWKDIERQAIEDALRANNGNRTRAAKQLGISLRTLQYRLKEYAASA